MKKIVKNNIVISVPETELEYYKAQGYKVVGEKEVVEKTISLDNYEKLETELKEKEAEIVVLNEKVSTLEESEKKKGAK